MLFDSDGVPSGQIAGEYGDAVHAKVRYDVLAVGNHELYNYTIARNVYEKFVPTQNGRYLASNVNLTIPDAQGNNQSVPLGNRFVKFKSYWGKKVTALGVLYNFAGADKGITVQKVADMVKESWFLDAISEQPDLFILAGHMPVRKDNWPTVIAAIRAKHPDTPILVAGGHTHIRDFVKYDTTAVGIESGRYLETIGWLSANSTGFPFAHVPTSPPKPLPPSGPVGSNFAFSRSYIDANRRNYALHANLAPWRFDTPAGLRISKDLQATADAWDLTKSYGTAPQDYYLNRVSPSDSHALLNLLTNQVLPTVISTSNPDRQGVASIVLANSGSQRADLYAGDFTKNDQYIVSPFLDAFLYIKDVPYQYAQQVVGQLNKAGAYRRSISSGSPLHQTLFSSDEPRTDESYAQGEVEPIYQAWRQSQFRAATEEQRRSLAQLDARADEQATLGYVTSDDAGNDGDDVSLISHHRNTSAERDPLTLFIHRRLFTCLYHTPLSRTTSSRRRRATRLRSPRPRRSTWCLSTLFRAASSASSTTCRRTRPTAHPM